MVVGFSTNHELASKIVDLIVPQKMIVPKPLMDLTEFSRVFYPKYQHAPHLALFDEVLTQATNYIERDGSEGFNKIIINVPPRHGKTQKISRIFPAWYLSRNPDHRVMLVSYGATLAEGNSRWVRNLIKGKNYRDRFGLQLARDSTAVNEWALSNYEGGMYALGIGGAATGKGCHILIVDDPIKNREEAESVTYREKIWNSFQDDLMTRLEPNGVVIVVMTRWQEDDLTGRLVKEGDWAHFVLAALAEEYDLLGREIGEPLWAERFPKAWYTNKERSLSAYSWSGLYQQKPTPTEGGKFKRDWFKRVASVPLGVMLHRVVRSWDLAMTEMGDFTVGVKMGEGNDGNVYVLDVARARMDWAEVVPFMERVILADGVTVKQGVEMAGYMSKAVKDLNQLPGLRNHQIMGYRVDKSKVVRSMPLEAKFGAGLIFVLDKSWTAEYVEEFVLFPNGVHDDQVDASAGAWEMLYPNNGRSLSAETRSWV
jgi:predicted phage terminase large subunit-like protein